MGLFVMNYSGWLLIKIADANLLAEQVFLYLDLANNKYLLV
jgi:hypothetical protein